MLKIISTFFLFFAVFSWEGEASPGKCLGKLTLKGRVRGKCYVEVSSPAIEVTPGAANSFKITGKCYKKANLKISAPALLNGTRNSPVGLKVTTRLFDLERSGQEINGSEINSSNRGINFNSIIPISGNDSWNVEGTMDLGPIPDNLLHDTYSGSLVATIEITN